MAALSRVFPRSVTSLTCLRRRRAHQVARASSEDLVYASCGSVLGALVGHELKLFGFEVIAHLRGLRVGRVETDDFLGALLDFLLECFDLRLELAGAGLEIRLSLGCIADDVRDTNPERLERRLE